MIPPRFWQAALICLGWLAGFSCWAGELAVTTSQANLRNGAGLDFGIVEVVRIGERLQPLDYQSGYALVSRASGQRGWIHAAGQGWTEEQVRQAMKTTPAREASAPREGKTVSASPPADTGEGKEHPLSLSALGLKQGHHFEGARSIHSQVFYFPLPPDGGARNGVLRLHYRTSAQINPVSSLRVDLNDKPARSISLGDKEAPTWLEVPVEAADLNKPALKVTVQAALVATQDRCFDERSLALFFVHLMPDSWLDLRLKEDEGSLRSAWSRLPPKVRIGVPADMSDAIYATVLETAVLLQQARHRVEVVPWPGGGADVVIAPEAELARAFESDGQGKIVAGDAKLNAVRVYRNAEGRQVIALSDLLDTRLLSREIPAWLGLLKADGYRAQVPDAASGKAGDVLDLLKLGLDNTQYVNRTVEWSMLLTPPAAPAAKWLDSLRLNVVVPPEEVAGKLLLYVYLNGALQEVRQLDQDGKPHSQVFDLRRSSQRVGANHLRIVVQRVAEEGDCTGDVVTFPVQFLPGSVLALSDWREAPVRFDDLRAVFSQGPELWVTPESKKRLAREVGILTGLFVNHAFPFDRSRLHFLGPQKKLAPKGPFILWGPTDQEPDGVAVHMDRGRVRVVDGEKRTLLEVDRLPAVTVAQLVQEDGQHGLWLAPAQEGALPPPAELYLDQDDVAFLDERGVVLTLASRQHALSHAEYPDYLGWLDLLERYRFWIIGLGWVLVVVFLLHLYRKARKHAGH